MENKPSYYAIIPANVRYDKDLNANAKLLYGEISCLCNAKGHCFSSNSYFANLYGVSVTSISKWISLLVEKGYIKSILIYKEGTKQILNRYLTLVTYPIEEKLNTPIEEKLKDNNTSINNTSINNNIYSVYGQNKNFAIPTQENQIDLYDSINEVENENNSLKTEKEKKEKSSAKKESRFIKPDLESINDYFFEIGCENYKLESEKFFDYYESNGWQVGKTKMKDWKATARNWNRNTKKFNNGQQTNNTTNTTGNAYEWKPDLQEQLESAAEHLRKINSF